MILALVRKELRETWLLAALALAMYSVYLSKLTGRWNRVFTALLGWVPSLKGEPADVPFVQDSFATILFFIGVALAIALGFRQSAWEPSQGTAVYLLHFPLPRRTIFRAKLLTGAALLLSCTLLPIVGYATWAAMPGTHPGPFEWSMTGEAFRVWLLMPLAYLGAFASGIRPVRWYGSRLLPLLSTAFPGLFLYLVPHWWLIGFPLFSAVAVALVSDILWEAETRDF